MKELKDKTAVITGAASGIGRSFARALAKEGMNLSISDINFDELKKVKEEIEQLGVNIIATKCDVSKYEDFENLASKVYLEFTNVDLLINNAGIASLAPIEEIELRVWKNVIDVNLWSIIHSLKAFLPKMIERKSGHIVNVSSGAGLVGTTEPLPYVTTKFAVVGLSEGLYGYLKRYNLNVSVVIPTYIKTNIFANAEFNYPKKIVEKIGTEKLEEIKKLMLKDIESNASRPDRVVRKYIEGIKNDQLYIFDSRTYIPLLQLKSTPEKYQEFIKQWHHDSLLSMKNYFSKVGLNYDDYY